MANSFESPTPKNEAIRLLRGEVVGPSGENRLEIKVDGVDGAFHIQILDTDSFNKGEVISFEVTGATLANGGALTTRSVQVESQPQSKVEGTTISTDIGVSVPDWSIPDTTIATPELRRGEEIVDGHSNLIEDDYEEDAGAQDKNFDSAKFDVYDYRDDSDEDENEDLPSSLETGLESSAEPFLHVPRYVVGVVVQDSKEDASLSVRIDGDGLPRNISQIPHKFDAPFGTGPGTIILYKREGDDLENLDWEFAENLGQISDTQAEIRALAYRSNTELDFPPEVLEEVESINQTYEMEGDQAFMEREAKNYIDNDGVEREDGSLVKETSEYIHGETRLDLRNREDVDIFTIDPDNARDFDDAISYREIELDGKKVFEIGVHIADVSHFVRQNSELEKNARYRQFTRYLKQITVPMLPEILANKLCSLEPEKDRLAFSTIFKFDEEGNQIESPWIGRSLIKSKERLTYKSADGILRDKNSERYDKMNRLFSIAKTMREARKDRGSIQLSSKGEAQIVFGLDGKAESITEKERSETSYMIEDFMLAANEAQGKYLSEKNEGEQALILRAHDMPPMHTLTFQLRYLMSKFDDLKEDENYEDLAEILELCETGLAALNEVSNNEEFAAQIEEQYIERGHAKRAVSILIDIGEKTNNNKLHHTINDILSRLLRRARYTTSEKAHFSLAVSPYLHATSPIRRYPDIIVQYLMDESLRNRSNVSIQKSITEPVMQDIASRANDAMVRSKKAERDVTTLAFLDQVENSLENWGQNRYELSGENALVERTDQKGIKVNLRIEEGIRATFVVPWSEVRSTFKGEDGRWKVKVTVKNKTEVRDAAAFYGTVRKGIRSVKAGIIGVDRVKRTPVFDVRGKETRWIE